MVYLKKIDQNLMAHIRSLMNVQGSPRRTTTSSTRGGEIACNLLQEHFILIKSLLREITREFNTLLVLVLLLVIILLEITDSLLFT